MTTIKVLQISVLLFACAAQASGFDTIGNGFGSKWGDDPSAGSGAIVTWSYITDGTTIDPSVDIEVTSTSDITALRSLIDSSHGAGAFDTVIARALATWSAVANITFVGPQPDSGLPVGSAAATTPHIRIGAFHADPEHWFSFAGAVGFGPPGPSGPDDFPLSGDILFNLARAGIMSPFHIAPGTEDVTPVDVFNHGDDLEGLFLHELGHAIGLNHPRWDAEHGANPDRRIMYVGDFDTPGAPPCCQAINRELDADDIAAAQYVYGLRGDYNRDGLTDAADYTLWRDQYGATVTSGTTADGNVDSLIDAADYDTWKTNFGAVRLAGFGEQESFFAMPVPELSTLLLSIVASASILGTTRAR